MCTKLNKVVGIFASRVRMFHSSAHACGMFHESHPKSGYQGPEKPGKEHIREGLGMLKEEIKLWKKEMQDKFDMDIPMIRPGIPDKIWGFNSKSDLDLWTVSSDADHGEGFSTSRLHLGPNETGLFEGNLTTKVPESGNVKTAGYCGIRSMRARKSFKRDTYWDWTTYTHLVMKVRGDGRPYFINIGSAGFFDIWWNDMYQFVLYTRGGPHWQYSKIPFSKFFLSSKGRVQDKQFVLPLNFVSSLGIAVGDKACGPFRLEIDWIGLEFDPGHVEDFAYELYATDKFVTAH
ncbi:unnamed protein product [Notodromas monacha]|uniref:NADH:ubiquinone oxidoreductase intermediate-associated protein 30 domain-containing protein n=1 Tax=Notodromas monacha TaxID=399045 RepID=A0A7R9BL24_9CRUS|nr:unnamed protein product [Notodromas monacha]CAG0917457.1 unnamed protein product [Notodromas monacha]